MKQLCRLRGLIGLQMSNQMPFGVTQVVQSIRLSGKLLHPVLAENAQAGRICLADAFYGKRLAHAHQRNLLWIAGRPARRCCDLLPHPDNIFRNQHKVKTTKDTKYHEGESLLASARSAGPSCARTGRTNASVPTQSLDGRGRPSLYDLLLT